LFHNDEFFGGEIVITSFVNIKDDVELQCRNIKRLAEGGEVGLILFYVGAFMKDIDEQLIRLADECDFPLICMPRNRTDLRYGEVISDVMAAIFKDQSSGGSLVVELLERVSRMPKHQQTVDTVVKLLAGHIRATVIVADSEGNVLNEAAWPRTQADIHRNVKNFPKQYSLISPVSSQEGLLYGAGIGTEGGRGLELFIVRENEPLPELILRQAAETVQLAVGLWSRQHDRAVISELVKAILQDEPIKMRRLADLFHIDVASVDAMWIATSEGGAVFSSELPDIVRELARRYCKTSFADIFEGDLVLFMDEPDSMQDAEALKEALMECLPRGAVLARFSNLKDTSAVREAFLAKRDYAADARRIFPERACFAGEEIFFAKTCRQRTEQGEAAVSEALKPLNPLIGKREADELKRTLAVYLLDTGSGLTGTAEKLYLHKNTVKYRLKCISDRFGYRVGAMPASIRLYEAVAIDRLLRS
jgi:DNA-binding PucR family transcriptional regulator